jgi:hypothetical protein
MSDLITLAREFQSAAAPHLKELEADILSRGLPPVKDDIVFQTLNGLPFPMTLCFFEPGSFAERSIVMKKCPGVQVGRPIPAGLLAGNLTVLMVEMMLAFLLSKGSQDEVCIAAIAADGRGGLFRSLGSDDILAWPMFVPDEDTRFGVGGQA